MSDNAVRMAIIGINGFGANHLKQALALEDAGYVKLEAVTDLRISEETAATLSSRGTRMYDDYKAMLAAEKQAQLVIVCTPIHLHASMGVAVMEAGFDLLLEKPTASVIEDADWLIKTMERTGKRCTVNFNTLSVRSREVLTDWILEGKIGEITAVKGIGLWKRTDGYYNRTPWAGKLTMNGNLVLDGTIMNPFSHLLNMLMCTAALPGISKSNGNIPIRVRGELYSANEIEGEDTSCIRIEMSDGPPVFFYATLCASQPMERPKMVIQGTKGSIECDYTYGMTLKSGSEELRFEDNETWPFKGHLMDFIRVLNGEQEELLGYLPTTRPFLMAANGAFASAGRVVSVPADYTVKEHLEDGQISTCIPNIAEVLTAAFNSGKLLSESGIPWAQPTKEVELNGFDSFEATAVQWGLLTNKKG